MKRLLGILFITLSLFFKAEAKQLEAYLSHSFFYSPEVGPYAEVYLSVMGSSVEYIETESGGFKGAIQITYLFKQDEEVKAFKRYELNSPVIYDTATGYVNFIDQQRILIPNGAYDFEVIIKDINSTMEPVEVSQPVEINFPENEISISDIELAESFKSTETENPLVKAGVEVTPNISDFYPEYITSLKFYAEIYNAAALLGENEPFIVKYTITQEGKTNAYKNISSFKRFNAQAVSVLFQEFDISKVPTGNYNVLVQVINKENSVLASKRVFFQRANESVKFEEKDLANLDLMNTFVENISGRDTLVQYVKSVRPIATVGEAQFIDKNWRDADVLTLKKFFYQFWLTRNNENPEKDWNEYLEKVILVNREFSTVNKMGYETDRGVVYLKYGPPNTIVKRDNEPTNYPYHIWHYYHHPKQTDARYIFYNPDLVTNEYTMLHSNVRGEMYNRRWQYELQRRDTPYGNADDESIDNSYGSEAEQFFNAPR
tara:strand:- start:1847 stop:3310 length:1464 start_codon:yes stop_codon:yes gene_type:complete